MLKYVIMWLLYTLNGFCPSRFSLFNGKTSRFTMVEGRLECGPMLEDIKLKKEVKT